MQDQTLDNVYLINAAVPDSAVGQLACNYTIQLPTSDEGYVTATAQQVQPMQYADAQQLTYGSADSEDGAVTTESAADATVNPGGASTAAAGSAQAQSSTDIPLQSEAVGFSIDPQATNLPAVSPGQCALVTDTFDPASYQGLGKVQIIKGTKPRDDSDAPDKICQSTTYTYTAQWTVAAEDACGNYIVNNTATVTPIGGDQGPQNATAYLEINACNSEQQALPQDITDAADSDTSTPLVGVAEALPAGAGSQRVFAFMGGRNCRGQLVLHTAGCAARW